MKKPSIPRLFESEAPQSLFDICLQLCCRNFNTLAEYDRQHCRYRIRKNVALPSEICEHLLRTFLFCRKGYHNFNLSPEDFVSLDTFVSIFENMKCRGLKRVNFQDSDEVTDADIAVISNHSLIELNISNCKKLTHLSMHRIQQIRSLRILRLGLSAPQLLSSTSVNETKPDQLDYISPSSLSRLTEDDQSHLNVESLFPNLRVLTINNLDISLAEAPTAFQKLLQPLHQLQYLDLSLCHSDGILRHISHLKNLSVLVLYDVVDFHRFVNTICNIKTLRHLDISRSEEQATMDFRKANSLLQMIVSSLPALVSLDISCTELAALEQPQQNALQNHNSHHYFDDDNDDDSNDVGGFRQKKVDSAKKSEIIALRCLRQPLEFLGLLNCVNEPCLRQHIPALQVAGDANEQQIITSLEHYMDRVEQLVRSLNDLFQLYRTTTVHNNRRALELILLAMENHANNKLVQISGSASLFYIMKSDEKPIFTSKVKRKIITALLNGMDRFNMQNSMMRNGCLTLCQFSMPHDVLFAYEKLVKVLLRTVGRESQDPFIQRVSIYLLNSLACQVDGEQKRLVGEHGAIEIMLDVITKRLENQVCDDVMDIAWSTMWNVTDETPSNCSRFLDGNGMHLFLECLRNFPERDELLRNMMGLLGNVAEVKELRHHMMTTEYISVFNELLDSTSDGIEVSYNSAGVLAHISSDGPSSWAIERPRRTDVLYRMEKAIESWSLKKKRNINYRSFEPILRLVPCYETPQVQHWAVWALANLTKVYPSKYCGLIKAEGGLELLDALIHHPAPYSRIKELARIVLDNHCAYLENEQASVSEDESPAEVD